VSITHWSPVRSSRPLPTGRPALCLLVRAQSANRRVRVMAGPIIFATGRCVMLVSPYIISSGFCGALPPKKARKCVRRQSECG